ncbi:hypothetical protein PanWU01x14_098080 [Parasponia andersonii]|uniref:Pentatricopeptide repeat n=1 Tax=Parasponia andersonii TaxID=3476 RepID=A0A2P5D4U0_PARAD|nr:hypothetical protein PanWU01x14_098080 [Parasponia andersonii]
MPIEPTASMLGALLNGCMNHGELDLADIVGRKLIEIIEPDHDSRYVGLSNVYAVFKRWDDSRNLREALEKKGIKEVSVLALWRYLECFIDSLLMIKFILSQNTFMQS